MASLNKTASTRGGGADESLALQRKREATGLKKCIYKCIYTLHIPP
jgi:hypothetical protein